MSEISLQTSRQVGVFIDRRGYVTHAIIGTAAKLELPDIGRSRGGRFRFRGLRLVHTHLKGEPLTQDDLTDLALLRFDLIACIEVQESGLPGRMEYAHLMPENPENRLFFREQIKDVYNDETDFAALIDALEDEFRRSMTQLVKDGKKERALLVSVVVGGGGELGESLAELEQLAQSAGFSVVHKITQRLDKLNPKYAIGKGKLEEIILKSMQLMIDTIIFDIDLAPNQAKAIADAVEVEALDRTDVILSIFEKRAQTHDGKLQVELARLRYSLPKLSERQMNLSRITGGIGALGPGETKLEVLRRRARDRIRHLENQIERLSNQRQLRRKQRQRAGLPQVSVIGYTNAGKSTLLNAMTNSEVVAEDKLFATLNPVSRKLRFPEEREIIITDTVGFIRDLPEDLVAAFRATLEELYEADLLLHIIDRSSPQWQRQKESVEKILFEMELFEIPTLTVFNKIDRLEEEELTGAINGSGNMGNAIFVSAVKKRGLEELQTEIERRLFFNPPRS